MTLIADRLERAGFKRHQMEARVSAEQFIKAGGSLDEWAEVYKAVHEKLSRGQLICADTGRLGPANAQPSQTVTAGHMKDADKAVRSLPAGHRPYSQTDIDARFAAKQRSAVSVFERELTRTGQQWGNVNYRDLDSFTEDAEIASAVKAHIGHLRGDARHKQIKDLMTPREFSILLNKVRKNAA